VICPAAGREICRLIVWRGEYETLFEWLEAWLTDLRRWYYGPR